MTFPPRQPPSPQSPPGQTSSSLFAFRFPLSLPALSSFVLTLALALGGVAVFVRLVDPYGRFTGAARIAQHLGPRTNGPLQTALELRRIPLSTWNKAQTVIIGDSRGRMLTEPRVVELDHQTCLNLSSGGATIDESLTLLRERASLLTSLQRIIITAPLERFTEKAAPDRCHEAQPLADSALRYLLNRQMCQDAWLVLTTPELPRQTPHSPSAPSAPSAPTPGITLSPMAPQMARTTQISPSTQATPDSNPRSVEANQLTDFVPLSPTSTSSQNSPVSAAAPVQASPAGPDPTIRPREIKQPAAPGQLLQPSTTAQTSQALPFSPASPTPPLLASTHSEPPLPNALPTGKFWSVIQTWREMYQASNPGVITQRLQLLHQTLAPFKDRGVILVFWHPPLDPSITKFISDYRLEPTWVQIQTNLQPLGPFLDLSHATSLDQSPFHFIDPVHTNNNTQLLQTLLHLPAQ